MSLKKTWTIIALIVLAISCKNKNIEADNIFKFREYINYTTSGLVSVSTPIEINLANDVEGWETDMNITDDVISITPHVEGLLKTTNKHTLDKIYKDVPKAFSTYTFQFKTITPNFTIITKSIESYDKKWQYMDVVLKSADFITLENAKKLVKASHYDRSLPLVFDEYNKRAKIFNFRIDSIERKSEDSYFTIAWDGSPIQLDNKGERKVFVPSINNFTIVDMHVTQSPEQCLLINFSDPLKKQQNFDGLITIENTENLKFLVDGNVLKVYPNTKLGRDVQVNIFQGISNQEGLKLKKSFSNQISFEDIKPQVRLIFYQILTL